MSVFVACIRVVSCRWCVRMGRVRMGRPMRRAATRPWCARTLPTTVFFLRSSDSIAHPYLENACLPSPPRRMREIRAVFGETRVSECRSSFPIKKICRLHPRYCPPFSPIDLVQFCLAVFLFERRGKIDQFNAKWTIRRGGPLLSRVLLAAAH